LQLSLQYPAWYFFLCILLGALASFFLYYRDRQFKELGASFKKWLWLLAVLRFIAVGFLAFLLLSPLLRTSSNRVEKPIVVLLQDNSQSIAVNRSKDDSIRYIQAISELEKKLSGKYEVKNYSFGSSLKEDDAMKFSFNEKVTDISSALEQIADVYTNQNLGAVILATDGIYNEGSSPAYLKEKLHVPVYTIGLGDTSVKRDLILSNVYYNRTVFLGDYFPVKAEWLADFCPNETSSLTLRELTGGPVKTIDTKQITFHGNEDQGTVDFLLKADAPGLKHYRLTLSSVPNESSPFNNEKDLFVEVQEKKEKVLIVANAPHPDIAALKQTIEETKNYKVDVSIGNDFNNDLKDYSLFILDQLPASGNAAQPLLDKIRAEKKSVLFILGAQSNINLFNNAQSMLSVEGNNNSTTDAFPVMNTDFTLFNLPQVVRQNLNVFPPLESPFGDYKISPNAVALFNQKIGNVITKYPMIVFQQDLNGRSAVVAGEGLWRWRMWDYLQHKNQDAFNGLISAVVQYLAVRPDERQFRVHLEKELQNGGNRIFSENETVVFTGELLNESNELIADPDVRMTIKDETGKEFPFIFSREGSSYILNAGFFQQGNYSWAATVQYNNKNLTVSGIFSVTPTQLELANTRADHQLLYALSEGTGGKLFYPTQLDALSKAIESKEEIKPVLYSSTRTQPLINLRWIFIPLLLLLAFEWGIRKFNGGY
jgi:hypothetical protein